ncbi:MAG: hypothetical protein WC817_01045 [Patescibacteria group bacterium]|jgi:hypothetical protein
MHDQYTPDDPKVTKSSKEVRPPASMDEGQEIGKSEVPTKVLNMAEIMLGKLGGQTDGRNVTITRCKVSIDQTNNSCFYSIRGAIHTEQLNTRTDSSEPQFDRPTEAEVMITTYPHEVIETKVVSTKIVHQ